MVNSGWRANEIGTASNSAEKKNRPREGVAEGGFWGNSATPERIQKADSPAVLLVKSRTPHKSFLFLLEEKNRRAQIKKCEENMAEKARFELAMTLRPYRLSRSAP